MRTRLPVLCLALLAFSGCDFEEAGYLRATEKAFHHSYPLKAGGRISVENFNGSVEVTGWDQEKVQIDGTQYASTAALRDAIQIEIGTAPDAVRVRTVLPTGRRGNMGVSYVIKVPKRCKVDPVTSTNGTVRVEDIEGSVRVRSTNGAARFASIRGALEAGTTNGPVDVRGLDGPAAIRTSNGGVQGEGIQGAFDATTTNGAIRVHIARTEPRQKVRLGTSNGGIDLTVDTWNETDIRASTSNGGVTVKLPAATAGRLRAHTSNASVSSDFDVSNRSAGKHSLEGEIGSKSGSAIIDLSTSNGNIRVQRL